MFGLIKHLFVPHHTNNHRAKILHNSSLFVIFAILLLGSFIINVVKTSKPEVLGVSYSISESELLSKVNEKRQQNDLPPLSASPLLSDAARRKAADMFEKNYWAHFSPDGSTSPWGFIRAAGYDYSFAGENLAKGFTDSNSIVEAWMDSPTHRDNILSNRYKEVGFAISPGTLNGEETVLVVEMFGSRPSFQVASTVAESEEEKEPSEPSSVMGSAQAQPTVVPQISQKPEVLVTKPTIDSKLTSRAASTVGLSFLAFAFLMDLLIVERKKIPRFVGHNLDHVILILLFLLFIVLRSTGVIL